MKENTWWPLGRCWRRPGSHKMVADGCRNAKSNPRPTRPKPNPLKIKSTNNIQVIKLNILNKFYQKESIDIFKQTKI